VPYMTRIPSDLARFGLKVELVPGWETRGSSSFAPAGVTDHWTAGPRGTKGRPSLNVCINGRPGLPGPLCNIYLAKDGTCVVVAAGRANHAGQGGFRGLVGNSAVYGIEAESGGDGDWTPEQMAAYPRLNAALLSGLKRDASWAHGHNEWTPRKIDIRDIISRVRADTAAALANPTAPDTTETSEMNADDWKHMQEMLVDVSNKQGYAGANKAPDEGLMRKIVLEETVGVVRGERISGAADVSRLAEELTPALSVKLAQASNGSPAGELSKADVEDALRNVLRSAVES